MTRKALISEHRKTSRGSFKTDPLPPHIRLSFKQVYISEVEKAIRIVNKRLKPNLSLLVADDETVRLDNISDVVTRFKDIFRSIFVEHFGGLVTGGEPNTALYGRTVKSRLDPKIKAADNSHKKEFTKDFKRVLGVDPMAKEPGLEEQLRLSSADNVKRITTLSSKYFDEIQDSVTRALRSGTANKSIIKEVQATIDKAGSNTRASASLIATDQIQKLNGDLDRKRQQANGGSRYFWRTRRNARVRDKGNSNGYSDHAQLEGAVFEWGHPPKTVFKGTRTGERNEPGQDINCFPAGTKISTKEGDKNIEDIEIGDIVQSHWGFKKVVGLNKKKYTGVLRTIKFDRKTIRVTPKHKIFVHGRGWVEPQFLKEGDKLVKLEKLFSGYIFNEKAARDIKHPHPELIDNDIMPISVNMAHCRLYFNDSVKLIKKNIRLVVDTIFFVGLFKTVLRNIANTKTVKPLMTNFLWFRNNPIFAISNSTPAGRFSSESRKFSFRISNPLGSDSFRTASYFNSVIFKSLSDCAACHPSDSRYLFVRPEFISVLFRKKLFKVKTHIKLNFFKPNFKNTEASAFLRTEKASMSFNPCFSCVKLISTVTTILFDFWHNILLLKGSSKHLHDAIVGLYRQHIVDEYVYNFEVEDSMSYFAEGILVENCKCLAEMVIDDLLGKKSKKLIEAEEKTKQLIEKGVL